MALMKLQGSDITNHSIKYLVDRLVGRATRVVTSYGAAEAKQIELYQELRRRGIETYYWARSGRTWSGMPAGYNANNSIPGYTQDWLDMSQEAAREARLVVDKGNTTFLTDADPPALDGVFLDYIRWMYEDPTNFPSYCTSGAIDAHVQLYKGWCDEDELILLVDVKNGTPDGGAGVYEKFGQMWPDWLDNGWVPAVSIMSYAITAISKGDTIWRFQPTDNLSQQSCAFQTGGNGNQVASDLNHWRQCQNMLASQGYAREGTDTGPDSWDFEHVEASDVWHYLRPIPWRAVR